MKDALLWKNNDAIIAGTTLRDPDIYENNNMALHTGGEIEAIRLNRRTLSKELGIALSDWTFAKQTHSDHVYKVNRQDIGKGSRSFDDAIADCDALYTKEKNAAIGVFHADCVPVLLFDPSAGIIAAIHSGWQGTVKEITRKTLMHLIEKEHVDPKNVQAYIGPAIAYQSFEVGNDVIEKVKAMSFDTRPFITYLSKDKALVDNKGLNQQMLLDLHVPKDNITICEKDTYMEDEQLFSYRRNHHCGRHLSFIMQK